MNSTHSYLRRTGWLALALLVCSNTVVCRVNAQARSETSLVRLRAKAERGHVATQFELGNIYYSGDGVPRNDAEAFKWYRRAAAQGHADAQYTLGLLYKDGRGTERDYVEAYKWFALSAARGNPNAELRMDTVGRLMDRESLAEAQRAAAEFRPGKGAKSPSVNPAARAESQALPENGPRTIRKEPAFSHAPAPASSARPPALPVAAKGSTENLPKMDAATRQTIEQFLRQSQPGGTSAAKPLQEPVWKVKPIPAFSSLSAPVPATTGREHPPMTNLTPSEPLLPPDVATPPAATSPLPEATTPPALHAPMEQTNTPAARKERGRKTKPAPVYGPVPPPSGSP